MIGSPVSSVAANLVMEDVEKRALETFADPPRLWKRHVDDTFVIIKKSNLSEFFTRVNTTESFVQHYGTRKIVTSSIFGLIDQMLIKSPLIVSSLS